MHSGYLFKFADNAHKYAAFFDLHFTFPYPLIAGVARAPQMPSQPVSSIFSYVLHCPLGLGELQACPFPDVVFPRLFLSAFSLNRKKRTGRQVSVKYVSPTGQRHLRTKNMNEKSFVCDLCIKCTPYPPPPLSSSCLSCSSFLFC